MLTPSLPSLLRERASLQPDDTALTFIDYEQDWAGVAESLTWSQLHRRALNVAAQLTRRGSAGDRAAILAPQGLDYVAGFLGAMQAGFIAVPLPVPQVGAHDERVSAVLDDALPTVILTTSATVGSVTEYAHQKNGTGDAAPLIIEVDLLDLDSGTGPGARAQDPPSVAYLQYTSGSTRVPAGVMITHRNLQVNFEQLMSDYFVDFGGTAPPDTTIVSWLPFYHDMGLILGVCGPILGGYRGELTSPIAFLQRPARWMQALAGNPHAWSAAPNFAFDLAARKTSDDEMAGFDLGADEADEVCAFLADAVRLANQEQGTIAWFALRTDATTFWIVDAFASDGEREAHLDDAMFSGLLDNRARLLDGLPEILHAKVLAAKLPQ